MYTCTLADFLAQAEYARIFHSGRRGRVNLALSRILNDQENETAKDDEKNALPVGKNPNE